MLLKLMHVMLWFTKHWNVSPENSFSNTIYQLLRNRNFYFA